MYEHRLGEHPKQRRLAILHHKTEGWRNWICSFLLLPSQCIFQASVNDEQPNEEDDKRTLQCNFIFLMLFCVKLSFFCTTNCFVWYKSYSMRYLFRVFLTNKCFYVRIFFSLLMSLLHCSMQCCSIWYFCSSFGENGLERTKKREMHGSLKEAGRQNRTEFTSLRCAQAALQFQTAQL